MVEGRGRGKGKVGVGGSGKGWWRKVEMDLAVEKCVDGSGGGERCRWKWWWRNL